MPDVRTEVEALLAEMRATALTIQDVRDTLEITAIVRQAALPRVPDDLIPAFARATVLGAWVQYDIRHNHPIAA